MEVRRFGSWAVFGGGGGVVSTMAAATAAAPTVTVTVSGLVAWERRPENLA